MGNDSRDEGRVIIIGGDAAGMSAASKIRRTQPDRDILVLEKTAYTSYSACGIPYLIGGLVEQADSLVARSPEKFRDKYNIDVRTQHEVVEMNKLIRDALTLSKKVLQNQKIKLEVEYAQSDLFVMGNPYRIEQVILNLFFMGAQNFFTKFFQIGLGQSRIRPGICGQLKHAI